MADASFSIKAILKLVDEFTAPIRGVLGTADKFGKKFQDVGKSLSTYVSAPIIGFGYLMGRTVLDFEQRMNNVAAVSRASGEELARMRDLAKELGAATVFSSSEAASGMEFLARAGWKVNDILEGMPGLLALAAATGADLGFAADVTSNIMGAFGMEAAEAGRMADILAATTATANVDLTMLSESFKNAGPVAKNFGMSIEETAAAIGLLGNIGIQGGEAGTALRNSMLRLASPASDATKMLKALGVATTDSQGNLRAYADIMTDFGMKIEKFGTGTQLKAMDTLFGVRTIAGATELIKQAKSGALQDYAAQIADAAGAAERMAAVMNSGAPGAVEELSSAFEGLQIAIAESGALQFFTSVVKALKTFVDILASSSPETMRFVSIIAGIAAVVGPVTVALGFIATAIAAISLPVLAVTAAITLLIAGIVALVVYWDDLVAAAESALGWIAGQVSSLVDLWGRWRDGTISTFDAIVEYAGLAYEAIEPIIDAITWLAKNNGLVLLWRGGAGLYNSLFGGEENAAEAEPGIAARTAAAGQAGAQQYNAEIAVRFEDAPPGLRVEKSEAKQPGVSIDTDVGYNMVGVY